MHNASFGKITACGKKIAGFGYDVSKGSFRSLLKLSNDDDKDISNSSDIRSR